MPAQPTRRFRAAATSATLTTLAALSLIGAAAAHAAPPGAPLDPATPPSAQNPAPTDAPLTPGRHPRGQEKRQLQDNEPGAAGTGALSTYLTYGGGWTQTSPHIYLVLWGADWKTSAGDPYNAQNYLYRFYSGIGGSAWNQINTQYGYSCGAGATGCAGGVRIQNPASQLKGWMYDTTAVPVQPSVIDMENAARRAARYFGDNSVNAQYIIAMASGHRDQKSLANGWCAWHHYAYTGTQYVSYTSMPYIADMRTTCGANKINAGTAGALDGVSILAGHEYAESETDPFLDAWLDPANNENADKCLQWGLSGYFRNVTLSTGTFAMQGQWSNYHLQTTGSGCYFF